MSLDPYYQLGVSAEATQAEIRNAYRRKARETHPDRNSDDPYATTRFQLVQEAYAILKDPKRRAAYDNGEDTSPSRIDDAARAAIVSAFTEVIQSKGAAGIIANVRRLIYAKRREHSGARKQVTKARDDLKDARDRFAYDGEGEDFLGAALGKFIADCEAEIAKQTHMIEVMTRAREILADYSDRDLSQLVFSGTSRASTTTGSW